ncbi:hypothetical protein V6N13_135826 [Hibiscus sabdariffa]
MIETFDPGVVSSRNSRKHRRLDDDPPDSGKIRPTGTIPPPSYKDSLMEDNVAAIHDADEEICLDMVPKSDRVAPDKVQDTVKPSDMSPPISNALLKRDSGTVDSFGTSMLAERRPRRNARIQKVANTYAPIQIQGSHFNPILASDIDEEVAFSAGNKVVPSISSQQARKSLAPSTLKASAAEFAGGIWVAWYYTISISIDITHFQFIHFMIINKRDRSSLLATTVYASLSASGKRLLWPHLCCLASSIRSPWIMFGDFNTTLYTVDR